MQSKFVLKPLHQQILLNFVVRDVRILIACFRLLALLTPSPIIESCWSRACEAFEAFNKVRNDARLILSYSMQNLKVTKSKLNLIKTSSTAVVTSNYDGKAVVCDWFSSKATVKVSIPLPQPELQSESFRWWHSLSLWFNFKTKFRIPHPFQIQSRSQRLCWSSLSSYCWLVICCFYWQFVRRSIKYFISLPELDSLFRVSWNRFSDIFYVCGCVLCGGASGCPDK